MSYDSPIIIATRNGDVVEVEKLLSKGADIHARSVDGNRTPILIASKNGNVGLVDLLLSKGAKIDDKDKLGSTPILLAATFGHVDLVKLLLSNGADIHDRDKFGTPLIFIAANFGHADVVKLLLSKGATIPENIGKAIRTTEMDSIFRNWPTIKGLVVADYLRLFDDGNKMDLAEYVGSREKPVQSVKPDNTSGGKKRKKSKKRNITSKKYIKKIKKSIKRRK